MKGIGFKNMKVFKESQWFDFKDITLLTGTNNSGKSSIINAMQMLQENVKATNIDELIKTEFKITTHQNKYGSIETFVNNETKVDDEYFVYIRRVGNIEYRIKIQVNKGLESFGSVKVIKAIDLKTNTIIFVLEVKNPYPDYQCLFNINYKYFVERFYEKCKNTEILFKRKIELDTLVEQVNKGERQIEDLKEFADFVSKEVSVYIYTDLFSGIRFNDLDGKNCKEYEKYEYIIITDENDLMRFLNEGEYKKINEIGVFEAIKDNKDKNNKISGVISEDEYNRLYAPAYKSGIFDFTQLWKYNQNAKIDFENLICSYYKKDFIQSNKLLCNDLITVLSHYFWEMKEKYSEEDPLLVPKNLTKTYINSLPDFGLIESMLLKKIEDSDFRSYIPNRFVHAKNTIYKETDQIKGLTESNFFETIYNKIAQIILNVEKENIENLKKGFDIDTVYIGSEKKEIQLIPEAVLNEIYADITKKIINLSFRLNNTYVSSNRFETKRSYSFSDNTDFTNLLKQVEYSSSDSKEACKEFISEWIKRFEIADELVLRPDPETGNFKAYLRNGEVETLLADYGLGTNQLLPVIFSLGIHSSYYDIAYNLKLLPRTVVIEEPEANLHPAMQSKLADLFVDASKKFKIQIIVETHSEYLIRKLQYLVADKNCDLKSEDVAIYYFYKPNHPSVLNGEVKQVEKIEIDEFGVLSKEFGTGFFDEALNWKFELLKLKNKN